MVDAVAEEVNLYTARKEHLLRPLIDIFEKDTGIKVNILTAKTKVLIKKILVLGVPLIIQQEVLLDMILLTMP